MKFAQSKLFKTCCILMVALVLMAQQPVTVSSGTVTANIGTTNGLGLDSSLSTIDTDLKANIVLAAGAHVIGHVINDSGSTTAVTGNVAVTKADGSDVTLGAKADAKSTATDTTAVSMMQVLKEISAMEQAPASRPVTNAGTFAVQASAGTNLNTSALALETGGNLATTATNTGNTATNVSTLDTDLKADPCGPGHAKSYAFYDASTNGATQLVALSGSTVIYVCSYTFTSSSSTANTLKLEYGTGSNCATSPTAMTPGVVLQAASSSGPAGKVNPNSAGLQTAAGKELCLLTNAAQAAQAEVSYVQQ